jgi:hypothetical protein
LASAAPPVLALRQRSRCRGAPRPPLPRLPRRRRQRAAAAARHRGQVLKVVTSGQSMHVTPPEVRRFSARRNRRVLLLRRAMPPLAGAHSQGPRNRARCTQCSCQKSLETLRGPVLLSGMRRSRRYSVRRCVDGGARAEAGPRARSSRNPPKHEETRPTRDTAVVMQGGPRLLSESPQRSARRGYHAGTRGAAPVGQHARARFLRHPAQKRTAARGERYEVKTAGFVRSHYC